VGGGAVEALRRGAESILKDITLEQTSKRERDLEIV